MPQIEAVFGAREINKQNKAEADRKVDKIGLDIQPPVARTDRHNTPLRENHKQDAKNPVTANYRKGGGN